MAHRSDWVLSTWLVSTYALVRLLRVASIMVLILAQGMACSTGLLLFRVVACTYSLTLSCWLAHTSVMVLTMFWFASPSWFCRGWWLVFGIDSSSLGGSPFLIVSV